MTAVRTISYENVQVNDEVFDNNYIKKFRRVIEITESNGYISLYVEHSLHNKINASSCYVGHKKEGISIKLYAE